jgi:CBS domain-containing protein
MARRFGVSTTDITLLPIGGVARLQRIPERPGQEFLVAIAGPAVNVAIVIILLLAGVSFPPDLSDAQHLVQARFFPKLLEVNLFLALFNLLPAFPMDGGRIFRALLAMRMDYARATRLAASVGQITAIGFGFLGLTGGNPILLLIALFVWIGAEGEALQVEERLVLKGVRVREVMITELQTIEAEDTLGHATDLLLAGNQHDFPVFEDGRLVGVLTRSDLMNGLTRGGREAKVADYMRTEIGTVEADSWLTAAATELRENALPCLVVLDHGRFVGMLTSENIGEYLMIRAALGQRSSQSQPREEMIPSNAGAPDDPASI